jgi:nifR3 family TIM-barrel protein
MPNALFVSDMISAVAIVRRNEKTLKMLTFDSTEKVRSAQIFGTDSHIISEAIKYIFGENLADHIDINCGCPVPKITRYGGGVALPYNLLLYKQILNSTVNAANEHNLPITVKLRLGIDSEHETYIEAGKVAADEGISGITLHARTGTQYYSGNANWASVRKLKNYVNIPVFGNGDIFDSNDAIQKLLEFDAIAIGRGALGKPFIFKDIKTALDNHSSKITEYNKGIKGNKESCYKLGEVVDIMFEHLELAKRFSALNAIAKDEKHDRVLKDFRKHIVWYLKGYDVGSANRQKLIEAESIEELKGLLNALDKTMKPDFRIPKNARVRKGNAKTGLKLPNNYLSDYQHFWIEKCALRK